VKREFTLIHPTVAPPTSAEHDPLRASLLTNAAPETSIATALPTTSAASSHASDDGDATVLRTIYSATTNRMLRVSVNGFFESLSVVLQTIEELDVDVIQAKGLESLQGAQGVEQGMTGTTVTGA
jgi:EKC/KEOPS complex subunit PCC1/LAGE3